MSGDHRQGIRLIGARRATVAEKKAYEELKKRS